MMTIYIDSDCRCHITNDGTMRAMETDAFDGKCDAYVEGHRYVPKDESWTRADGKVFEGEMVSPWMDNRLLEFAQTQYEADLAEIASAYQEGVHAAYDQE